MSESFSKKIPLLSLIFLFALAVFVYGLAVGTKQIWPYKLIKDSITAASSIIKFRELVPENRLVKAQDHMSREEFVVYSRKKIQNGYYAFMGYDGTIRKHMAWLMDVDGNKLHSWDLSYEVFDSDGPLNASDAPHAFEILSDGSLIVNFDDGDVMARIDQCSKPIWTKNDVYHHSLTTADDGSIWTWRGENTAYGPYQYIENFDAVTGKLLSEIGLVEDLLKSSSSKGNIFSVRSDFPFKHFQFNPSDKDDLFHPNDVDVLKLKDADKFPDFNAGDLLLSFRNLHLLMVIDPISKQIKWWSHGPWRFQHDPDFTSDGKISVFSNNTFTGRSEIITVDPSTGHVVNELENGNLFFYTTHQGKHQYLPNGNLLITISGEGRAVQVTKTGQMVFEYNNISAISDQYNEYLANGIWLDSDFFKTTPNCTN